MSSLPLLSDPSVDDAELARRIRNHDKAAFESLMRRNNGALYRVARAILKNTADAEDVLQESYLAAYRHIGDFRAEAKLSTWLTRIVVNQALGRRRSRHRSRTVVPFSNLHADERVAQEPVDVDDSANSPEHSTSRAEIRSLLERNIEDLPVAYRTVFMLREVDELSGAETAECLSITEATVRSRLFRSRGLLRDSLSRELDMLTADVFAFGVEQCNRVVAGVLARLWGAAQPDGQVSGGGTSGPQG
jgi:RNA polymerase sigma-70 factor (ECF subfamily)